MYALRSTCVSHVVWHHPSRTFYLLPCIMWLVTMSSDVTCCVTAWSCHSNPNSSSKNRIKENKSKRKWKWEIKIEKILSPLLSFLTLYLIYIILCTTSIYMLELKTFIYFGIYFDSLTKHTVIHLNKLSINNYIL